MREGKREREREGTINVLPLERSSSCTGCWVLEGCALRRSRGWTAGDEEERQARQFSFARLFDSKRYSSFQTHVMIVVPRGRMAHRLLLSHVESVVGSSVGSESSSRLESRSVGSTESSGSECSSSGSSSSSHGIESHGRVGWERGEARGRVG